MARFKFKKRDSTSAARRLTGESRDPYLKPGTKFFKPADGANTVRFMPPTWDDAEHYGLDLYMHYQVGPDNISYLCPRRMKNEVCPICEEMQRATESGDDEYAKTLYPRRRVLAFIVDVKAPKDGVKAWPMPYKKVDQQIVIQSTDPETSEYFAVDDPEEGFNVVVTKSGSGLTTDYTVNISRHATEFKMTDEIYEYLMANPLPDILTFYDYDHIAKAFGSSSSDAESNQAEDEKEAEPTKASLRRKAKTTEAPTTFEEILALTSEQLDKVCEEHTQLDLSTLSSDEEVQEALAFELYITVPEDEKKEEEKAPEKSQVENKRDSSKASSFKEKMTKLKQQRG